MYINGVHSKLKTIHIFKNSLSKDIIIDTKAMIQTNFESYVLNYKEYLGTIGKIRIKISFFQFYFKNDKQLKDCLNAFNELVKTMGSTYQTLYTFYENNLDDKSLQESTIKKYNEILNNISVRMKELIEIV